MYWLELPAPASDRPPAFSDLAGARSWLAAQPQAQPLLMQSVLGEQLCAIDATRLPPGTAIGLLNLLHGAIVPAQTSLEVRFTRRPLPMANEEEKIFQATHRLWTSLGIAYLRLAPHLGPKEKMPLLFRAANALRMAQYNFFQASRECPPELDRWLLSILIQGSAAGILRLSETDPHFRHFGEANIAGMLAWAFLLRLLNPYHLSAAQLVVANRALSRWRELCSFRSECDPAAPQYDLPLIERLGANAPLPADVPTHVNIHAIARKIHARIVSLRTGATPESLKLGRELSATACTRLLGDIERQLLRPTVRKAGESGQIALVFGAEHAFALFRDEALNPDASMDVLSETLANDRMAVFGFDKVGNMTTTVKKIDIPSEPWILDKGTARRTPAAGPRRSSPCLIAAHHADIPRLGVLRSLQADSSGVLNGTADWFPGQVEACRLQQPGLRDTRQARIAVFLIRHAHHLSLLLPSNAPIRPGLGLAIEGRDTVHHVVPTEVVDRGNDFVHYACRMG